MKVRLTYTVDVDPESWREVYGCVDVREDVRDYFTQQISDCPAVSEAEARVTLHPA